MTSETRASPSLQTSFSSSECFSAPHEPIAAVDRCARAHPGAGTCGLCFPQTERESPVYQHLDTGRRVSVPVHTGDVPKGTLRQILRDADLTVERLLELL
ncbi:MAG TPA: type II toxin-antitoxin system HicA family toxin [Thermoanaerobaculia bacterium]|nr:type II toxin-antitoxin system HicA family toxin [Thermoanaerobaculia bacterium]